MCEQVHSRGAPSQKEAILPFWLAADMCPFLSNLNALQELIKYICCRNYTDCSWSILFIEKYYWNYYNLTKMESTKITCKTDNSCLYGVIHSSSGIADKRLHIEMTIQRELINRKEKDSYGSQQIYKLLIHLKI